MRSGKKAAEREKLEKGERGAEEKRQGVGRERRGAADKEGERGEQRRREENRGEETYS